jgi:hypothetical protein
VFPVAPAPLKRATALFKQKQAASRQVWQLGSDARKVRPGHAADSPAEQYFDLHREDLVPVCNISHLSSTSLAYL